MFNRLSVLFTAAGLLLGPLCSLAADTKTVDLSPMKDTRSEAQKTVDRNLQNAKTVSDRQQQAKTREELRDKSHDFPRVKTSPTTSVGVDPVAGTVNARKTTP